jgi:hypothetical protein
MRSISVMLFLGVLTLSCAPVRYLTFYEGGHDPLFDMKGVKTIGFTPFCWTNFTSCDELTEKQLYVYARDELQKRGYKVFFIPREYLETDPDTSKHAVYVKEDYPDMPDLTLTLHYWQGLGNVVNVPGQSTGYVNWGKSGGSGYYGESQSYNVQTYFLVLSYTLWSGKPKFMNKTWQGVIKKGSPKLDLFDQAQDMAQEIFYQKFDR